MWYPIGGDWRFFWEETIPSIAHLPSSWDTSLNTGIGEMAAYSLWIVSYLNLTALITKLGISWNIISILFWILPPGIIAFLGSFFLFRYFFKTKKIFGALAGIIYATNSYFLLVFGGGQLGVSLAYAVSPFLFLAFLNVFSQKTIRLSLLAGLILGLQILFDPRITYVTLICIILYWLFFSINRKLMLQNILTSFVIPFGIAFLLHSYWVLPLIIYKTGALPHTLTDKGNVSFFSFADFSHSLSLLHPNWPENIFGKTYFLRPEFLLLPLLAFGGLWFVSSNVLNRAKRGAKPREVLFFALLALIGVFLSKGVNEPFGFMNQFLFTYLPGMSLFRDPTKWYVVIALSYAMLIPLTLQRITLILSRIKVKVIQKFSDILVGTLFVIFWFIVLSPTFTIGNNFQIKHVPEEYRILKDFLFTQQSFFRTLWIPQWQRFGYFSDQHPAIGRYELFRTTDPLKMIRELRTKEELLRDFGVKYVIVPYDSEGELFINDRVYDPVLRQKVEDQIDTISWLKKIYVAPHIAVYELQSSRDHFYTQDREQVQWKRISPTNYQLNTKSAKIDRLVFAERFSPYWEASINEKIIPSKDYNKWFNSFDLGKERGIVTISYKPQELVNLGLMISFVTIVLSLGYIFFYDA